MEDNKNIVFLKFADSNIPEFKEMKGKQWVLFGEDNLYPDYLVKLYNKSPKHNAIINGKITYILGGGFYSTVVSDEVTKAIERFNSAGESLNDIAKKCAIDCELFGGFYLNIIPDRMGNIAEIYHLDYSRVRANEDCSTFFYKNNWSNGRENAKHYPAFNKNIKRASIFMYKQYRPSLRTYSLPGYIGAINYIESDIEVSKHTFNNAKTGFTPSKLIQLFTGEPSPEQQRDTTKRFENKFTGADGSKIILAYHSDVNRKILVDDLGTSDLTKEDFKGVDELITQNIFAGHEVTTPILFGIQEPGKLGARNELRVAYEIFQNTYAAAKQKNLEKVFNFIASLKGIQTPLYIRPLDPVGIDFSDQSLIAAAPRSWVLEKMGIDTNKYTDAPIGNKGLTSPALRVEVGNNSNTDQKDSTNDNIKNLTAKQHQQLTRIIREFTKKKLTKQAASVLLKSGLGLNDEEISQVLGIDEFFKEYSEEDVAQMFEEVGDKHEDFQLVYSKEVAFLSDKECSDFEMDYFSSQLLKDKELFKEDGGLLSVIKKLPVIKILYTYEKKPGVAGAAILPTTRPFCEKLVTLSQTKYFSRADIEAISERVGYSVWDRRGGFWKHKNGDTTAYCRHIWKANIVIKK